MTRTVCLMRAWALATVTALSCSDTQSIDSTLPPTGVMFAAGDGQVTIAFTAPTGAGFDRVVIQRAPGAPPSSADSGMRICDPCQSPVVDSGLQDGTTVGYAVFALYRGGQMSALVTGTVTPSSGDAPPGPVSGATFVGGDSKVTIAWTDPSDSDLAKVVIRRAAGATLPTSVTDGQAVCDPCTSPFVDSGLANDESVSYAIFAVDRGGQVSTAVTGSATPLAAPGPVSNATFIGSDHQVTIDWTDPLDTDLARIVIRRAAGRLPPSSIGDGDSVCSPCTAPFFDTGLANHEAVSYAIFAVDDGGLVSIPITGTAVPVVAPAPVTGASFTATAGAITIAWIDPPDLDLAKVVIRRAAGATPPPSISDGAAVCDPCASPVTDGGLPNDALVSYAIFAVDDLDLVSIPVTGSATPVAPPGPVTGASFVAGVHAVTLDWTDPPDADLATIAIRRAAGTTPPASITEGESVCDPCAAPLVDDGLLGDAPVAYAIFAVDRGGLVSTAVTGSATPLAPPGPVTDATFVGGFHTVTIAWTSPTDVDLARIVIRRGPAGAPPATIDAGLGVCGPCTSPTDDPGLASDIPVSFAIFAVDQDGLVSTAVTGTATPVAPPGPVTDASFVAGNHQVTLGWTDPSDSDLAKIVIRRASGETPPSSISAGTAVCDPCLAPVVDAGLDNQALFSYAIFAVDEGGLVSTAVTGSATPLPPYGLPSRPSQTSCRAFTAPPTTGAVQFVDRFPGISVNTPTGLFQRPGDNSRWYVTERGGRILYFPNDPGAGAADLKVALDLHDVTYTGTDCSMGSLSFPPDFAASKHAYVGYCYKGPSTGSQLQLRVSRFATSDGGATFDRASEQIILALDFPVGDGVHTNVGLHAVDVSRFGSDGYLYVSVGDGGPQGRIGGIQAQDVTDLRGKLLRFDVSDLSLFLPDDGFVAGRQRIAAHIPPDNPFAAGGGQAAIFAYGFRNPWQWHFDRATGDIWLGDVGNSSYEEIDRGVQNGGNYGWGYWEGSHCTNGWSAADCANPIFTQPLLDYQHGSGEQQGNAVTGGVVYRGTGVPSMTGAYVFGDSSAGRIWTVRNVDALMPDVTPAKELLLEGAPVSSFDEDQDGELYATILYNTAAFPKGRILALAAVPAAPGQDGGPPALLSQTGCFDSADASQPAPDLIPFAPAATLYSDGASKRRWMVVPDGQKITVQSDGDFTYPPGSVLVKEFSLGGSRVETRFLVRQEADGRWAGYSYQWNAGGTDAALVPAEGAQQVVGAQTWSFPSRAQCSRCHTKVAGDTLGPEVGQLNHIIPYPATGIDANQMDTLDHIGLLDLAAYPRAAASYPAYPDYGDESRTVEDRARAYLHANCSMCHRPDGPTFTPPDFRFATSLANMSVCNVVPTISALEGYIPSDPELLAPGAPERSVLHVRLTTIDPSIRMPPLARSLSDSVGTSLVGQWIEGITSCP